MEFRITGRNLDVSDKQRQQVEKKLGKLSKFFSDDAVASVALSNQKDSYTVEVTIPIKNSVIRAEESSDDLYASIDMVEEIIERQIKNHRTRLIDKTQSAESFSSLFENDEEDYEEEDEIRIDKVKRFDFKPMTAEEACLQMDLVGHSFFVFRDADSGEVAVVYKRNKGGYGLIAPE